MTRMIQNNQESHEMLPPTELPAPEVGSGGAHESVQLVGTTEITGAQAVELPQAAQGNPMAVGQNGAHTAPATSTNSDGVSVRRQIGHVAGVPAIADDTDLIEKEWVQKAKDIVARTKDDPRAQNREMGVFKADYVKKRFNKDIKVSE